MPSSVMPLTGPPPDEIPLDAAPLVRVIAQVRFPLIASVEKREFIALFQEAIRGEYPALRPEQNRALVVGPEGVVERSENRIWRFNDPDEAWRVTLAPEFLALETTAYTSREDFLSRLKAVLGALQEHVNPQVIDRLGVRYIDRISGADLVDLPRLVQPQVAGVLAGAMSEHAHQSVSENLFNLPEESGQLTARWGRLPPNTTIHPGAVEAIDEPSWLLDLDAFLVETRPFDPDSVAQQAKTFSERIYSFFRWAVTEEFLRRYGGEL